MPTQEEQLVMAGDEAEVVLTAPAFTSVVNHIVDVTLAEIMNSKPDEAEKRERLYNHYRAIADVVNTLKQRVEVRDQIRSQGDTSQEEQGL